jgi:hypothetical protein
VDCGSGSRKAPHPGPRCATCNRENRQRIRDAAHANRILVVYGLSGDQYWQLYELQGRCCAICKRAKGIKRRLAVDHDHKTGKVRGLLCGTCNKILGHLRDDPDLARGIASYLEVTPMERLVRELGLTTHPGSTPATSN